MAKAEFDSLSAQLAREYPNTNGNIVAEVVPLRDHLAGGLRVVLPFLLGAAAILLAVACANVANLLLAHGAGRVPSSPCARRSAPAVRGSFDRCSSRASTSTLDALIWRTLKVRRSNLFLIGGFALATLLLATAGVYGVMSFSTTQRTREFGVRVALGAGRRDIMRLVLGEG